MAQGATKLNDVEEHILEEVRDRMAAIARLPEPDGVWEQQELSELKEYGPVWTPRHWLGAGSPVPEKIRVRYLRAVHVLIARGLLIGTTSLGGRLMHLKTTPEGLKALKAMK